MLIPTRSGDIVAAGQKSGMLWGVDAKTGAKVWGTLVGPGSSLGGLEWGSATDGKRIYFAVRDAGQRFVQGVEEEVVEVVKGWKTGGGGTAPHA